MVWEIAVILMEQATIISHYRQQETTSKDPAEYFRFVWELRIVFNKELTKIEDVRMGITKVLFAHETAAHVRGALLASLRELLFPDCLMVEIDRS